MMAPKRFLQMELDDTVQFLANDRGFLKEGVETHFMTAMFMLSPNFPKIFLS